MNMNKLNYKVSCGYYEYEYAKLSRGYYKYEYKLSCGYYEYE